MLRLSLRPSKSERKGCCADGFVGDQAAEWLSGHSEAGAPPFAVWVSFAGPHDPYDPPEEMAGMYREAPIPPTIGSAEELASKPKAQQSRNRGSRNSSMYRYDPGVRPPPVQRVPRCVCCVDGLSGLPPVNRRPMRSR